MRKQADPHVLGKRIAVRVFVQGFNAFATSRRTASGRLGFSGSAAAKASTAAS